MTASEIVERHEGGSVGIVERHKRDMNWQQGTPVGGEPCRGANVQQKNVHPFTMF